MFRSSIVSAMVLVALTGCQSTNTSEQKDVNNLKVLSQRLFMTSRQKSPDTITLRERKI